MSKVKMVHGDYIAAGSPEATVELLQCLASSEVPAVRRRVAENALTPIHVLVRLAQDFDPQVRIAVGLNNATPYVILSHLVYDDDPDVRYWLATASYIPRRLIVELSADPNPYVSQRAARTAILVQSGLSPAKLGVFEFLGQDHSLMIARLEKLLGHYSRCSQPHSFDDTIDAIDCIRSHFARQHKLCLDEVSNGHWLCQDMLNKASGDHRCIDDKIASIIAIHHDGGSDLCVQLNQLLELVLQHIDFAEAELFVALRRQLSNQQINVMNMRAGQALLTKAN